MTEVAITREAIEEDVAVIQKAIRRLANAADFKNPAPVILTMCPGHEEQTFTVMSERQEHCFIHLSQEAWKR